MTDLGNLPTSTISRRCRTCAAVFTIDFAEQAFYAERARVTGRPWPLPWRCLRCRRSERRAYEAVPASAADGATWYERACLDCGETFKIGPSDVRFLAERGWPWPRRCRPCRVAWRLGQGAGPARD